MKRTSKIISIFLTLIIISGLVVITLVSVNAIGNYGVNLDRDCYIPNNSQLNPYSKPQCTWFCWGRTYEKLGIRLPLWHNANTWDESAEADPHYTIGTEARNNSIMVENSSGTGHVAFVEKVENGYAYITEGNYAGSVYHEDRINLSTMIRDSWANHVLSSVRYIYLKCTTHKWDNGKVTTNPTCIKDGVKTYTCTVCGEKKTETIKHSAKYHSYSVTKCVKATLFANGKLEKQCKHCKKKVTETIYHHKSTVLKKKTYTYSGKNNKPGVTVKDIKNKVIPSKYYKVTYLYNKNVGKAKAKITFKTRYSGTVYRYFVIKPKGTSITKLSAGVKAFTAKWTRKTTQTTGYQIQYATNSKFTKGKKTVTIKSNKTTSKKISGLNNNTKYYVRVRTYKTVNGLKYFSAWSKSKSIKTYKKVFYTLGGKRVSIIIPQNWISIKSGNQISFHEKYNYEQYKKGNHKYDNSFICSIKCVTYDAFKNYLFYRQYFGKIGSYYYSMYWLSGYGQCGEKKADNLKQEALNLSHSVANTFSPQPKTKLGRIKNAYFNFVSQNYKDFNSKGAQFDTAYITKDNVPELVITFKSKAYNTKIYTYKKVGTTIWSVTELGETNGNNLKYYYKKNVVSDYFMNCGVHQYRHYSVSTKKIQKVLFKYYYSFNHKTNYYDKNYKLISKSEYNQKLKKLTKGAKAKSFNFHKVSLSNMEKYLQ